MKALILASLLASAHSFAGPFEKFIGNYEPVKSPKIVKENILYCNWFNFSLIQRLEIDHINGNEGLKIISSTNGGASTLHSMMTFVEYSHPEERYPREATLSGTDLSATYIQKNWSDDYSMRMSQVDDIYVFETTYNLYSGGRHGACHYRIELQKID